MTIDELTSRLGRALQRLPEVRLAFLFGSSVSRGMESAKDVDVAIAFNRPLTLLEQGSIATNLEKVTEREVDLVDLTTASTVLTGRSRVAVSSSSPETTPDWSNSARARLSSTSILSPS